MLSFPLRGIEMFSNAFPARAALCCRVRPRRRPLLSLKRKAETLFSSFMKISFLWLLFAYSPARAPSALPRRARLLSAKGSIRPRPHVRHIAPP